MYGLLDDVGNSSVNSLKIYLWFLEFAFYLFHGQIHA